MTCEEIWSKFSIEIAAAKNEKKLSQRNVYSGDRFLFPIILNIFVIFPKIMQTVFNFAYIHERGITLQNFEIFLLHFIST